MKLRKYQAKAIKQGLLRCKTNQKPQKTATKQAGDTRANPVFFLKNWAEDPDWLYVRTASMVRKIYIRKGMGVGLGSKRWVSRTWERALKEKSLGVLLGLFTSWFQWL